MRLESLYRDMNVTLNEVRVEVGRAATKEELLAVAQEKAPSSDVRALTGELSDKVTRAELHQNINNHVKPLVSALQSLEQAMGVSEQMSKQNSGVYMDKVRVWVGFKYIYIYIYVYVWVFIFMCVDM
jgi:hypothetical protein